MTVPQAHTIRCRVCQGRMLSRDDAGQLLIRGEYSLPHGGVPNLAHRACEKCARCGRPVRGDDHHVGDDRLLMHPECERDAVADIVRGVLAAPVA